jgi:L-ribulokinase
MLYGLSMQTRPRDVYLALLQAIACGTREIIEQCQKNGIMVNRLLATGGITGKNPLLMQEYANLLNRTVYVGQAGEGPALGAAIFAAVAAGIYETPVEAHAHMGIREFTPYEPDADHREQYEGLYIKNHKFRQLISIWKSELTQA